MFGGGMEDRVQEKDDGLAVSQSLGSLGSALPLVLIGDSPAWPSHQNGVISGVAAAAINCNGRGK